jgi:hypothetical protein
MALIMSLPIKATLREMVSLINGNYLPHSLHVPGKARNAFGFRRVRPLTDIGIV